MALQDKITQIWVKATGRRIDPNEFEWLIAPSGGTTIIGDRFIFDLAQKEDLELLKNLPNSGLLESVEQIGISKDELNPKVADFYENTSNYDFEIWSEWKGPFRPFGKLLSIIFSKRLQQLNLPLNSIDTAKGLKSEIIKLKDKRTKKTKWTIWYRIIKSTNDVIYSGIYTTCTHPKYDQPLLKVVFPLPNGNASVIMTETVEADGSLLLSSDGKKFGDNGFYFTLADGNGNYWARFVRPMHEWIRVYEDEEEVLRADHNLNFYGMRFLNLHYKMNKKS
ncbi:hypothetical protein [Leeuwenhoekiella nanhaiensis]|uniref:Uncharacterized protein n=1 Tax=Leeuwenhoekiella nanhaiensis TaxID=1655491 RepID=A0A2G1VR78_9FLAO|nr:hypothetical protein [Leeuwenhoekiella nanhaiensis]PHQ29130.1 hypothetical protein CJ305_10995 [Leeuwenhoekiella nanhaiensis]